MNELKRQELICRLVRTMRENGTWPNQVHLQKSVLFLQGLLQVPLGYRFVMYKHGPLSYPLRRDIGYMLDGILMDYKPNGWEGPSYLLGRRGEQYSTQPSKFTEQIEFVTEHIASHGTRLQELIGTAFYVQLVDESLPREPSRIAQRMCRLRSHIDIQDGIDAAIEVEKLRNKAEEAGLSVAVI